MKRIGCEEVRGELSGMWWVNQRPFLKVSEVLLRNGVYDFKSQSRDGLGFDWPINYKDLASYTNSQNNLVKLT